MRERKIDRRIQKTHRFLQDALMELILEKGYEAITVQDILDRANVGRSTFYEHFGDKDALLLSQFEYLRDDFEHFLAGQTDSQESPWQLSQSMFQHAESHRPLYQAMAGKQGGNMALEHIRKYLTLFLHEHLKRSLAQQTKSLPPEILTQFIVSAFIGLLTWWLDNETPYSAEQMNAFFRQLVEPGIGMFPIQ